MTRFWLAFHNAVAHPLMVVLPARLGNALHDWSARRCAVLTKGQERR